MTIYQTETDPALRTQLVGTLGSMEAVDQLVSIAKTDKDPNVRARAVRAIGNRRNDKATQALGEVQTRLADAEERWLALEILREEIDSQ